MRVDAQVNCFAVGHGNYFLLRVFGAQGVGSVVFLGEGVDCDAVRRSLWVGLGRLVDGVVVLAVSGDAIWRDVPSRSFDFLCWLFCYICDSVSLMRANAVGDAASFGAIFGALRCQVRDRRVSVVRFGCQVVRFVCVVGLVLATYFAGWTCDFFVDVPNRAA